MLIKRTGALLEEKECFNIGAGERVVRNRLFFLDILCLILESAMLGSKV